MEKSEFISAKKEEAEGENGAVAQEQMHLSYFPSSLTRPPLTVASLFPRVLAEHNRHLAHSYCSQLSIPIPVLLNDMRMNLLSDGLE